MAQLPGGETVALDRRTGVVYSRATRPIDFGRPGVVDPMVYRFGLMYDLSAFSQTLGDVARTGLKGEFSAYRQMLLFQKKLATITQFPSQSQRRVPSARRVFYHKVGGEEPTKQRPWTRPRRRAGGSP